MDKRNACLRKLCRTYLKKLRYMARKHGLDSWLDDTIELTKDDACQPTEHEVEMLARCVDEERLQRTEVPQVLDKSYRECVDDEDFEKIRKLRRVGIYSKVSTLLYASKKK